MTSFQTFIKHLLNINYKHVHVFHKCFVINRSYRVSSFTSPKHCSEFQNNEI